MPFELDNVVPWGRNLNEYRSMFHLTEADLIKKIISFGDGPASFNFEMLQSGRKIISLDPIYRFSRDQLQKRIDETRGGVMEQTRKNMDNFTWKDIKTINELEEIRMRAMSLFLDDLEAGKREGRYIAHALPRRTDFSDLQFDLGLSSHFLLLYSRLGLDFHIRAITEMLRICKEIRIFPILNLDAERSEVLDGLLECFGTDYRVRLIKVIYEFQKNGNEMLKIKRVRTPH